MNFSKTQNVLIQGITEPLGRSHARLMKEYGTPVVAGISPGDGGQEIDGIPIFDLVSEAVQQFGRIDTTLIFVPPYEMLDAALEAISSGIGQIILIPAGMPPLDMVKLLERSEASETLVLGPNCPGIIVPGQVLLGTHPTQCYSPGRIGLISCSDTLTYQVALELTQAGWGQSIALALGRETILGSSFPQWLQILEEDDQTDAIVLVGEIDGVGGEARAAEYIIESIDKPVVAYLAGQKTPHSRPRGHAIALLTSRIAAQLSVSETPIASWEGTTTQEWRDRKLAAFAAGNIPVAQKPSDIPRLLQHQLKPAKPSRSSRSSRKPTKNRQ